MALDLRIRKVTITLYKTEHAKLKIIASINDESLDKMASNLIEERINETDIVKTVAEGLENLNNLDENHTRHEEEKAIHASMGKIQPTKKVTVSLSKDIHKKLKIIASAEGLSLEKSASYMVWDKINDIDVVKLVEEEFNSEDED